MYIPNVYVQGHRPKEASHNKITSASFAQRLREITLLSASLKYVGGLSLGVAGDWLHAIQELEQKQIVEESLIRDPDEISPASEPEVSEKLAPAGA